jgi:hypothetical protein
LPALEPLSDRTLLSAGLAHGLSLDLPAVKVDVDATPAAKSEAATAHAKAEAAKALDVDVKVKSDKSDAKTKTDEDDDSTTTVSTPAVSVGVGESSVAHASKAEKDAATKGDSETTAVEVSSVVTLAVTSSETTSSSDTKTEIFSPALSPSMAIQFVGFEGPIEEPATAPGDAAPMPQSTPAALRTPSLFFDATDVAALHGAALTANGPSESASGSTDAGNGVAARASATPTANGGGDNADLDLPIVEDGDREVTPNDASQPIAPTPAPLDPNPALVPLQDGVPAVVAAFVPRAAVNGETTSDGARAGARFIVGLDSTTGERPAAPARDAVFQDDSADQGAMAPLPDRFFLGRAVGGMLLAAGLWQTLRVVEGQRRTVRPLNQSGAA